MYFVDSTDSTLPFTDVKWQFYVQYQPADRTVDYKNTRMSRNLLQNPFLRLLNNSKTKQSTELSGVVK